MLRVCDVTNYNTALSSQVSISCHKITPLSSWALRWQTLYTLVSASSPFRGCLKVVTRRFLGFGFSSVDLEGRSGAEGGTGIGLFFLVAEVARPLRPLRRPRATSSKWDMGMRIASAISLRVTATNELSLARSPRPPTTKTWQRAWYVHWYDVYCFKHRVSGRNLAQRKNMDLHI